MDGRVHFTWMRNVVYYDFKWFKCAILAFLWLSMELLYKREGELRYERADFASMSSLVARDYISHQTKNIKVKT